MPCSSLRVRGAKFHTRARPDAHHIAASGIQDPSPRKVVIKHSSSCAPPRRWPLGLSGAHRASTVAAQIRSRTLARQHHNGDPSEQSLRIQNERPGAHQIFCVDFANDKYYWIAASSINIHNWWSIAQHTVTSCIPSISFRTQQQPRELLLLKNKEKKTEHNRTPCIHARNAAADRASIFLRGW
jgi:hypothetical protein